LGVGKKNKIRENGAKGDCSFVVKLAFGSSGQGEIGDQERDGMRNKEELQKDNGEGTHHVN